MPIIEDTLALLGLEQKEVQVYLALLDLGESTATQISERTSIGRVNVYQIAAKLIEKGLASYLHKGNARYFVAADPQKIMMDLRDKEEKLLEVIPELSARFKNKTRSSQVEIYRGQKGIDTVLKMIVRERSDYCMIGGASEFSKECDLPMRVFVKQAEKLKIKGDILERQEVDFYIGAHEQFRYLSSEHFSLTTKTIWGNKVATLVWSRPFYAIVIESEEIAKSELATFRFLWKQAILPTASDRKKRLLKI